MAAGSNPAEEPPGDIPLYGEWQIGTVGPAGCKKTASCRKTNAET